MTSTSPASRKRLEDAEIFQVLEGKNNSTRPSTRGISCTTTYRKFLGKMASYIYFDNFFSSTNLMKMLLEQETYSCSTTRANRKNWPTEFRKPTVLKLKRGESRKMQHEDVTAIVWQDKRVLLLLATNSDPQSDGLGTRKTGKGNEEIEIACPQAVINYTKHMGGVDVSDQRSEYYGVGRSSKNCGNL